VPNVQETGLRRLSVHADEVRVDLALPAEVPIATLIPAIVDIAGARQRNRDRPTRYQLSRPGLTALEGSTTLAEQGIRDGAVLVLSRSSTEIPAPQFDDEAEAVSASLAAVTRPWTGRAARMAAAFAATWLAGVGALLLARVGLCANDARHVGAASAAAVGAIALVAATVAQRGFRDGITAQALGLLAVGFAAVAGLLAVPGAPGAPNALLAATTAAVTAVVVVRTTGHHAPLVIAVAGVAVVSALAALAATLTTVPRPAVGAICVVVSLAVIEASAPISILFAGLSPRFADDAPQATDALPARAIRANAWLTGLVGASSTTAACGAVTVAIWSAGGPHTVGVSFAMLTGAVLLSRARSHRDIPRAVALIVNGTLTVTAGFVVGVMVFDPPIGWLAATTAALTAVAFLVATVRLSPAAQRAVGLLERVALAILVPLACWVCGLYGAARGLTLS
jgi:type VII secretion integral membrane protein EccD